MAAETHLSFIPDLMDASWGPEWVPRVAGDQPRELTELRQSAFLWYNFRARSEFKLGGADFSISSPPFCVVDHVLMLRAARSIVKRDGSAILHLSDRSGQWTFTQIDEQIEVRTSGFAHRGGGRCTVDAFGRLVDQSLADALALIFGAQPVLRDNAYLRGLAEGVASETLTIPPLPD